MSTKADVGAVLGFRSMEQRAIAAWNERSKRPGINGSAQCRREFMAGWRAAYRDAQATLLSAAGL